jgi:hypothetical protein
LIGVDAAIVDPPALGTGAGLDLLAGGFAKGFGLIGEMRDILRLALGG